jgi:hypothetical protein
MSSADRNRMRQMVQATERVCLRSPELPRCCPCCGVRLVWGWSDDDFLSPCDGECLRLYRIPRPDQTVFCPSCEGRLLN